MCGYCGFATDQANKLEGHRCNPPTQKRAVSVDSDEAFEKLQESIANQKVFISGVKCFSAVLATGVTLLIAGGVAGSLGLADVENAVCFAGAIIGIAGVAFMACWFIREFGTKVNSCFELVSLRRSEYNRAMNSEHKAAIASGAETKDKQLDK